MECHRVAAREGTARQFLGEFDIRIKTLIGFLGRVNWRRSLCLVNSVLPEGLAFPVLAAPRSHFLSEVQFGDGKHFSQFDRI
jgi:hypothetical protein